MCRFSDIGEEIVSASGGVQQLAVSHDVQLGTTQTYPTLDRTSTAQVVAPTLHTSDAAGDGRAKEAYVRATLKWQPTDTLTAVLKANYGVNENNNPGAGSVLFYCPTGVSAGNPAIACGRRFASSANRTPLDIAATQPFVNKDGQQGNQYEAWAVNLGLTLAVDNLTLSSVTNYNWNRNTFQFDGDSLSRSGAPGIFATEDTDYHAFSQEFRAQSDTGSFWDAMAGAYYQQTMRDYNAWTASGGLENSAATPGFRRYLANSKDSQTKGGGTGSRGRSKGPRRLQPARQRELQSRALWRCPGCALLGRTDACAGL